MQTFLPYPPILNNDGYPHFLNTAKVLDYKRLGKQRVEGMQILNVLGGRSKGWQNHPAVKMWRGYHWILFDYVTDMCLEWINRGYKDTIYNKLDEVMTAFDKETVEEYFRINRLLPPWMGNEEFHASHRSNLLRKNPQWYGQFGWTESPLLPYVWPDGKENL